VVVSMKKGEVQQVFIYLMVIIVVGTLMLVAYQAINGFFDRQCELEFTDFKGKLRADLDRYSNAGSGQTRNYQGVCNYDEICFVDSSVTSAPSGLDNEVIKDEIEAETGRNIFLVSNKKTTDVGFAKDGLSVEDDFVCIPLKGGKYTVRMEGVSRGEVRVSDPLGGGNGQSSS